MREKRNYSWADGKRLSVGEKTLVMGILNVTPDSFSDGGRWNTAEAARAHAKEMIADGADFIDVGAESTRPGSAALSAAEETERLFSFLPALLEETSVPISVDTYHWQTAERALSAGAHILNDVWGFQFDEGEMARVCAAAGVPVVLMHNRTDENEPGDIMELLKQFLSRSVEIALAAGVAEENIILDPGLGFGKTTAQNLEILRRIEELTAFSFPILLAPSRKRFIGAALGGLPATERDEGTGAVCLYGAEHGCEMVRVHDVKGAARMLRMGDAIFGYTTVEE